MTEKKKKYVRVGTPTFEVAYCSLNEPDTGKQYSDGKYKVTLKVPKDHPWMNDKYRPAIADTLKRNGLDSMPDGFHLPVKDGDTVVRKRTDEATGEVTEETPFAGYHLITFKTQEKPDLLDSRGNPLPSSVMIFSGDEIKVGGAMTTYEMNSGGIVQYLNAVRLIVKNNSAGDPNQYWDDDDYDSDGYVAPQNSEESNDSPKPKAEKSEPVNPDAMGIQF